MQVRLKKVYMAGDEVHHMVLTKKESRKRGTEKLIFNFNLGGFLGVSFEVGEGE